MKKFSESITILLFSAASASVALLSVLFSREWYGDILHNIWTYGDFIKRFRTNIFDANIYFPISHAIVLQEIQIHNVILFLPFYYFESLFQGYAFVLFLNLVVSVFVIRRVALYCDASPAIALFVACCFPILTYTLNHAPHVQLLGLWLPFLTLLSLVKIYNAAQSGLYPIKSFSLLFLLMLIVTAGPNYIGIASLFMIASFFAVKFIHNYRLTFKMSLIFSAIFSCALAVNFKFIYPFFVAYRNGLSRNTAEQFESRVDLINYVMPLGQWIYGPTIDSFGTHYDISQIFPGFFLILFIVIGLFSAIALSNQKKSRQNEEMRDFSLLVAIVGLLFFFISLGPVITFKSQPIMKNYIHLFFYDILPLLRATRFSGFYGSLALISALIMGARGFTFIFNKINISVENNKFYILILPALLSIVLLENITDRQINTAKNLFLSRQAWSIAEPPARPIYLALNDLDYGAVISVPADSQRDYIYMYYSLYHNKPIVNGHSGFVPQHWRVLADASRHFPSTDTINLFRNFGIRYVVVHSKDINFDCAQIVVGARKVAEHADDCIFEIENVELADQEKYFDFREGGNGRKLLGYIGRVPPWESVSGWSNAESWGTWSIGGISKLYIPVETSRSLRINLRISAYLPRNRPHNLASIWVNGVRVAQIHFTNPESKVYSLPIEANHNLSETLTLEFRFDDYRSPYELGLGGERRRIAIGLSELSIEYD